MREIKFRFLRTDINSDKFWEYRIFPDDLYNNDLSDLGANFSTLSQFTGLKDKNGKEIYEGDIVMTKDLYGCKIIWDLDFARWQIIYPGAELDHIPFDCEVIGNIFENPELVSIDK